ALALSFLHVSTTMLTSQRTGAMHSVTAESITPTWLPLKKIYQVYPHLTNWTSARDYCREHHTDLAMIENGDENAEVSSLITDSSGSWIGLFREPWRWTDGSQSSFRNWRENSPNNAGGEQFCIVEDTQRHVWDDDGCDKQYIFICHQVMEHFFFSLSIYQTINTCEESKSEQTFSSVKPNKICIHTTGPYLYLQPLGFGLTSYSYKRFIDYCHVDQPKTWTDAQKYCREKYTDLLSIESNDDLRLMNSISVPTTWSWIGLHDDPKSWKGVMGKDENSWRWSATSETSENGFQNWAPTEPNNFGSNQHCNSQRYWADWKCDIKHFFWCYKVFPLIL
uniref:C-type lectin domain-containing protein n=1 Tax=Echeneis naucrates TaxID=173247 RepID=A0A665UHN0_ECHNA